MNRAVIQSEGLPEVVASGLDSRAVPRSTAAPNTVVITCAGWMKRPSTAQNRLMPAAARSSAARRARYHPETSPVRKRRDVADQTSRHTAANRNSIYVV
ncbi:hypothetical protein Mame01_60580 [Microbispora amethystogenes]|nr:hypothetical protein Mame01_60580 [Microbispora amethystogenes]